MEQNPSYKKLLHEDTHYKRTHLLQTFFSNNSQRQDYEKLLLQTKSQTYDTKFTNASLNYKQQNTPFKTTKDAHNKIEIKFNKNSENEKEKEIIIQELQKQVESLRDDMRTEIDQLKYRILQCEQTNQQLSKAVNNKIDVNLIKKHEFDTIAEEYKSSKKQIQESSLRGDQNIKTNYIIKDLTKIGSTKTKQTLRVLKNEIHQNLKRTQESKSKEKKQNISSQTKITKTPEQSKFKSQSKEFEVHQEFNVPSEKINRPLESPYRGAKTPNQKSQFVTFADKIKNDNMLNKFKKDESRNQQSVQQMSIQLSSMSSIPYSPLISNKGQSIANNIFSNYVNDFQKGQLATSQIVENPKFLDFINTNTASKNQEKQQNEIYEEMQSQTKSIIEESKKEITSPSYMYQKWLDITGSVKDRGRESEQSTERGKKPSLKNRIISSSKQSLRKSNSDIDEEEMASDDCDEKRSYTSEPKQLKTLVNQNLKNLNHSIIGLRSQQPVQSVNSVYQSSNMELSRYISKNKSNIDYNNAYNVMEFGGKQALIENKGSKCICQKTQLFQNQQQINQQKDKRSICSTYCKYLTPQEQK